MNEVIEDTPGTVRLNGGNLEQLREVKHFDEDGSLVAIEQRWVPVEEV